jgi:hypothetical protein
VFIFDFEVFMYDWLVVFKNVQTNEYITIVNDVKALKEFHEKNKEKIFFGYNNKSFDNIIFNAILSDADPYGVMLLLFKEAPLPAIYNTFKIKYHQLNTFDLMQDILGMSLKEAEGYMQMSVEESTIDFDIDRRLTDNEIKEVISYCVHDVDATEMLLKYRQGYVRSKMNVCKLFSLPLSCLDKTNASLAALILDAKKAKYDDELTYDLPDEVIISNPKYKKCLDLYVNRELDYKEKLKIDIAGVPHLLAYGGIHGAIENFEYQGEMWQIDAASYYPTLMIQYHYVSRNLKDISKYAELYHTRIEAKKNDKPKAEALKLLLNTAYGAMKSKFNNMYDPKMANSVCITGQLLLVDLIEKIEPYCTLVQSNTDGIMVIPKDKDKLTKIIDDWQIRTRIKLEVDTCLGIWQKDVNNYIMKFEGGKIKTKGAYVTQFPPVGDLSRGTNILRNSGRIIDIAVVNYFVNNIMPEDTILKHNILSDFQIITKTGSTYTDTFWKHKDGDKKVNKVNRVFATKHQGYSNLYKTKINPDGTIRKDSIANLPEHCYVDNEAKMQIEYVDRQYYIDLAKKRISDFRDKNSKFAFNKDDLLTESQYFNNQGGTHEYNR